AREQIDRLKIGRASEQYDIRAFDAGGHHRAGTDAAHQRLSAHDRHRAQLTAADLHRLDIQSVLGEEAEIFAHPYGKMGDGGRCAVEDAARLLSVAWLG